MKGPFIWSGIHISNDCLAISPHEELTFFRLRLPIATPPGDNNLNLDPNILIMFELGLSRFLHLQLELHLELELDVDLESQVELDLEVEL